MMDLYDADGNLVQEDPAEQRMAQIPRKVVRRLEKEAEEGRKAQAELEQMRKERAFVQAGVPVDDKRAGYFIAGYSGEMTPEAIKQEWTESFGGSSTPSPLTEELADLQAANDFVAGGGGTPPPDKLAERNAKLAALSPTDPAYQQKFDAIFLEYGGRTGSMVG